MLFYSSCYIEIGVKICMTHLMSTSIIPCYQKQSLLWHSYGCDEINVKQIHHPWQRLNCNETNSANHYINQFGCCTILNHIKVKSVHPVLWQAIIVPAKGEIRSNFDFSHFVYCDWFEWNAASNFVVKILRITSKSLCVKPEIAIISRRF